MLRITKLTDYSLLILCELNEVEPISASKISLLSKVPLATTNKILKILIKKKICISKSGKIGGFLLVKPNSEITLLDVVLSMEGGEISLTHCNSDNVSCKLQEHCKITKKMQAIDKEIYQVLSSKTIASLIS